MKKIVLSLVLAVFALAGYSQDIKGKWLTEAGDAQVEIYEANGKDYKCSIWLEDGKLKVRGYIGFLYETQTWKRK